MDAISNATASVVNLFNEALNCHVRGVDVMRVRDGKVSEKLSYVKG